MEEDPFEDDGIFKCFTVPVLPVLTIIPIQQKKRQTAVLIGFIQSNI